MRGLLPAVAAAIALLVAPSAPAAVEPVRWCGTDRAQTDRVRDRLGGPQVHVVYAIPSDGVDRFDALVHDLVTDVAAIDAWWRREDPTRTPRFDLFEFPGCASRFGLLDVSAVRLPEPAAVLGVSNRFSRIAFALTRAPFELADLRKKYLVFYDGEVAQDGICGAAAGRPDRGGDSFAIVFLRSRCGASIGGGRGNALVAAHELVHMLGALPVPSPNECAHTRGHVCDSASDILFPELRSDSLDSTVLDVNRDDYYGHPWPFFDVRNSRWLLDPARQFPLALRVAGQGVIGTEPDGQGCTTACTTEWDAGTPVQIAAEPAPGFAFASWGGACAGRREASCLLEVDRPADVVASFRRIRVLTVSVSGGGSVGSTGVRCARTCRYERLDGQAVALRATARRGWRFVRWTGRCTHRRVTCSIRMDANVRVSAVFARR